VPEGEIDVAEDPLETLELRVDRGRRRQRRIGPAFQECVDLPFDHLLLGIELQLLRCSIEHHGWSDRASVRQRELHHWLIFVPTTIFAYAWSRARVRAGDRYR
jgi:hypothetical protein